jgi:omega-amidase
MDTSMQVSIIQPSTIWEDKAANFEKIEGLIGSSVLKTDLVVLPEMFSTGFTLNADTLAEDKNGRTYNWMKRLAGNGSFAVCGSMITSSDSKFYNHFQFVTPGNEDFTYYKRHLFGMAGENKIFSKGNSRIVFNYKGFRFLPIICYDLRFPVWIRNRGDYDVLICVSNWPDIRREAWNSLLKARAIENQCYVVGVNRVGKDKEGLSYAGESVIIDPLGKILCDLNLYEEGVATADISLTVLQSFREKFPVWRDADDFSIII